MLINQTIPFLYFPATVLVVDDDNLWLNFLYDKLHPQFNINVIDKPATAIQVIHNAHSVLNVNCLTDITESQDHGRYNIDNLLITEFDFATILNIARNKYRYNEVGVVLVDYLMPQINGIELCQQIKSRSIKKILLTGEVDEMYAVTAFNQKLIDYYIKKIDASTINLLTSYIEKSLLDFFIDHSKAISPSLYAGEASFLTDINFINLFNEILLSKNIKEFYLIDKSGVFLLINDNAEEFALIVKDDANLNELVTCYQDEYSVASVIEAVSKRKVIPFFGIDKSADNIPLEEFSKAFYPAHLLKGNKRYFWNIIDVRK